MRYSTSPEGLGSRLREARNKINLSQRQVAKKLGYTTSSVCQWELGNTVPEIGSLIAFAKFTGVSVAWLLGEETKMGKIMETKAASTVWVIHWTRGSESGVYRYVYEDGGLATHILSTLEDANETADPPFVFELLELEKVVLQPKPVLSTYPERARLPHRHLVGEPGTPLPVQLLTVRTLNMLKMEDIETVEQLCCWPENQLLRLPNFGRKSLNELKEVLHSMGFSLKGQI